jgi:hypothetical protein
MAPETDRPDIARKQFYFVDACSTMPDEFLDYEQIQAQRAWEIDLTPRRKAVPDNRTYAHIRTAGPAHLSYAISGRGSVFGEALLRCLGGGASVYDHNTCRWSVTVSSLCAQFKRHLDILNQELGTNQTAEVSYVPSETAFCNFDRPPKVGVKMTMDPAEARAYSRVAVFDDTDNRVLGFDAPLAHAREESLNAGLYRVLTETDPLLRPAASVKISRLLQADPPACPWHLTLPVCS